MNTFEEEIECYVSNTKLLGLFFLFLALSIKIGINYSYKETNILNELSPKRSTLSSIKNIIIETEDYSTVKFKIKIDYIFRCTLNNIQNGISLVLNNGGFNVEIKTSKLNITIENDTYFVDDQTKPKINSATLVCALKAPFYGQFECYILFNGQKISDSYLMSIKQTEKDSSLINCGFINGKRNCNFNEVILYNNAIDFFSFYQISPNYSYIPEEITFLKEPLKNKKFVQNFYPKTQKIAIMHDKGDLYTSIIDCIQQFSLGNNKRNILIDKTGMVSKLKLNSLFNVNLQSSNIISYKTLIWNENRNNESLFIKKLKLEKKKERAVYVTKSFYENVKEPEQFIDSVIDQCYGCKVVKFDPYGSIKSFVNVSLKAKFVVGLHLDEMIGCIFGDATLIDVVPKNLGCSNWIEKASDNGLRVIKVLVNEEEPCNKTICSDCKKIFQDKLEMNLNLFANGLEKFADNKNNNTFPNLMTIDMLENKIYV